MSNRRHFGIMSRSAALGGTSNGRPAYGARNTDRAGSLHPLPAESIQSFGPPLERLNLSETVKDIAALAFTFLFLGSVSVLFAASVFMLFFCDLR